MYGIEREGDKEREIQSSFLTFTSSSISIPSFFSTFISAYQRYVTGLLGEILKLSLRASMPKGRAEIILVYRSPENIGLQTTTIPLSGGIEGLALLVKVRPSNSFSISASKVY